jgi:hypothetical protein
MTKILCLVIDSVPHDAWRPTYETHRRIWQECFDASPEVDGYFLYSDPALKDRYKIEPRRFTFRCEERLDTILHKTIKAIDKLLDGHEYVIRTNISSLWDFPLLKRLLPTLPRKQLYTGNQISWNPVFVTGSGMLLSRDAAKKIGAAKPKGLDPHDDIAIAQILHAHGIRAQHRPWYWYDYARGIDQFVPAIGQYLHYRLRNSHDPERRGESEVTEYLFSKLYNETK